MSVASDSHSPFLILPTRSDSAPPLSTHLASGQDSSLKLPFLPTRSDSDRLILTLSDSVARLRFLLVRFSHYQILSPGCGFCSGEGMLGHPILATPSDSRFLIPVFVEGP